MLDMKDWKVTEAPVCPYCNQLMEQMDSRYLDWESPYLWVCFNNDCTLFKKGWDHMMETVGQLVSYRCMIQPQNGERGVIPAFSQEYLMKNGKPANPNYETE